MLMIPKLTRLINLKVIIAGKIDVHTAMMLQIQKRELEKYMMEKLGVFEGKKNSRTAQLS